MAYGWKPQQKLSELFILVLISLYLCIWLKISKNLTEIYKYFSKLLAYIEVVKYLVKLGDIYVLKFRITKGYINILLKKKKYKRKNLYHPILL